MRSLWRLSSPSPWAARLFRLRTTPSGRRLPPPFSIRPESEGGSWTGIGVELWERIAEAEGFVAFEYVERELAELVADAVAGRVDVAVAALTITAEREEAGDFTHEFYSAGLGIVVRAEDAGGSLGAVVASFFTADLLKVLGGLGAALVAAGALVWLFERKRNPEQFGGDAAKGFGSGVWWSAVTMTTVGYGDKAPQTAGGRVVAFVWMFASIIMISAFTASVATSMTLASLQGKVRSPEDLARVKVAAVRGSTSLNYLRRVGASDFLALDTAEECLEALVAGRVEAAVHDAPIMQWLIATRHAGEARTLPFTFEPQSYGFLLPEGSPLREPINRSLLRLLRDPAWPDTLARYLGG